MNTMNGEQLGVAIIEALDKITSSRFLKSFPYGDRALLLMFKIHEKVIVEVISGIVAWKEESYPDSGLVDFINGSFCKTFRQTDVIDDNTKGMTDMVIWNLINNSTYLDDAIKVACKYYKLVNEGKWTKHLFEDLLEDIL